MNDNKNSQDKLIHFKLSMVAIIAIVAIIFATNSFFDSLIKVNPIYKGTVDERIAQIGSVYLEGEIDITAIAAAPKKSAKARSGKEVYSSTCQTCHAIGVAGAPKYGNKADWSARTAQGLDGLLKVALKGKGAMPAKGTCGDCSDDEIKDAITYMLESIK